MNITKRLVAAAGVLAAMCFTGNSYAQIIRQGEGNKVDTAAKKKKVIFIDKSYFKAGVNYGTFINDVEKPFGQAYGINVTYGSPVIDNYAIFDIFADLDMLGDAQKKWFARAYDTAVTNINSAGNGYALTAGVAVSPIIVNKKKVTVTVGPEGGIKFVFLPEANILGKDTRLSDPNMQSFFVGARASIYIANKIVVTGEFSKFIKNTLTNKMADGTQEIVAPVNLDMVKVGIGYKF